MICSYLGKENVNYIISVESQVYLKIASNETREQLFGRVFEKVDAPGEDEFMKESALDLARALLPYQKKEEVQAFYDKTIAKINDCDDYKKQKKYYRYFPHLSLGLTYYYTESFLSPLCVNALFYATYKMG